MNDNDFLLIKKDFILLGNKFKRNYSVFIDDYVESLDIYLFKDSVFFASFDIYITHCKVQFNGRIYDLVNKGDLYEYRNKVLNEFYKLLGDDS